jgi:hypothetical protein
MLTLRPLIFFMDEKQLQINKIKRAIGQLTFRVSIMQLKEAQSEFSVEEGTIDKIREAVKNIGISVSELDEKYYFTSFDNWLKIIETLNPIVEQFVWKAEKFDCDNRANLICSLCSLIFEINTVAGVFCDVYEAGTNKFLYRHYANLIIDKDNNVYLWDVDNKGQYTKITKNNPVIGNLRYNLMSIRVY